MRVLRFKTRCPLLDTAICFCGWLVKRRNKKQSEKCHLSQYHHLYHAQNFFDFFAAGRRFLRFGLNIDFYHINMAELIISLDFELLPEQIPSLRCISRLHCQQPDRD